MFDLINKTYAEALAEYPFLDQNLREVMGGVYEDEYYSYPTLGLEIVVHQESGLVSMVVVYRESQDSEALNRASTLPPKLSFGMSRSEVENSLGQPEAYFEPSTDALLGKENSIARYRIEDYLLFISYSETEMGIDSVSYTAQFC